MDGFSIEGGGAKVHAATLAGKGVLCVLCELEDTSLRRRQCTYKATGIGLFG